MDFSVAEAPVHPTKPKLLKRFLRVGGSSKDKVHNHSFGSSSEVFHKGQGHSQSQSQSQSQRRSLSASPTRIQAPYDSRGSNNRRRGSVGSSVDSRNASPSAQRGLSVDYKRDITELDDLIRNNREGGNTKKMTMSPTGRKNRIPPKVASNNHHSEAEALVGKSSSSSIGLTKTFSGLSLTSAEKSVIQRGLKKENADPSFVARFTSALNADLKRVPLNSSPSSSPMQSRSSTPKKLGIVSDVVTNGGKLYHSPTPRARSRGSPPRSLTINNNMADSQQAVTSPLSVEQSSQYSNPEENTSFNNNTNKTSTNNDKRTPKSKGRGGQSHHESSPFDENATAREVLDALEAQKTNSNAKSQKPQMKAQTPSKEPAHIANRSKFSPVSLALGLVGGIGAAVQTCSECACGEGDDSLYHDHPSGGSLFARNSSLLTMDTYERDQLLDDIERFERMNSFDTHGTMTTTNTMTTLNTTGTNDTGYISVMTGMTGGTIDDNSKLLPADVVKDHYMRKQVTNKLNVAVSPEKKKKKRKKKKKKKKRKKVVGFEYPPISTLKEIPRINSEERKKLFFTEDELEEYESDRKYNVSDDVEVVAVEGSDSEEEETESESDDEDEEDSIDKWIAGKNENFGQNQSQGGSALKPGKYASKKGLDTAAGGRTPIRADDSFGAITKPNRSISAPRSRRNNTDGLSQKSSSSSSKTSEKVNSGESSKAKKLKGVQIYLRQRSKAT